MNKIRVFYILILLLGVSQGVMAETKREAPKISFWNSVQKGANIFNHTVSREDIKAAKNYGVKFIRLAPDKFPSVQKDFLLGNADHYTHLVQVDLDLLKNVLDMCAEEKMPVVLTMLSLPGSRWKQNNNDKDDLRLWRQEIFQKQAAAFWKDVALELRSHPAIVGYDLLNEPHPERLYNTTGLSLPKVHPQEVQQKLFTFYTLIIKSIRSVDPETPIILESSAYGDPKSFQYFKAHEDPHILYSFHIYEPYSYTNYKMNRERFTYPGEIEGTFWNKKALKEYMCSVLNFQAVNALPSHRILVGEFGGNRRSKGLPQYFKDLIDIFKEQGWHFAFYAFREDTWEGMDYELGNKKLSWHYWQALEKKETPKLERRSDVTAFKVLQEALQKP